MTQCQHCTRKTELPLCTPCTHNLANLLSELPWLLHQLDLTITRQDHLHPGGTHTTHETNPINVGAMELSRDITRSLCHIALDVSQSHASRRIPALTNASTTQVVYWLRNNVNAIQSHPDAGDHYRTIKDIVGDPQPGPIHAAINRPDSMFAGPCPTIRAHDRDGAEIRCNHTLWAHDGETHTVCPRCGSYIDVEQNRRRATTLNDLLPYQLILEVLDNIGEPIQPRQLAAWIQSGRLKAQGFLTRKGWAKRRTRPSDPRVYSLARARQLRSRQPQPATT